MKVQKIITDHPYTVIIMLFLFSILVRLPNLNRPLSKHHEFCTSTCLRTMQIWADAEVTTYNFNPIMTYPGYANKFINNQTLSDFDKDGDEYYKSYPPGAYLLPFYIFKIMHIYPDVLPIEIYNLLLHLIECIFLFNIVMLFASDKDRKKFVIIGIVAVIFQLFNPCALWFHSNAYMTDMQASTFFVVTVYLILVMILQNKFLSPIWLILLGLSNFILSYSEYLGVTFTAVACLYCFIKAFQKRQFIFPLVVIGLSCLSAIVLMLYQYSLINGFHQLIGIIRYRYNYQSGYSNGENLFVLVGGVLFNYVTSFLPELFFIGISAVLLSVKKSLKTFLKGGMKFSPLIVLLALPVILHHLIFLRASQYDFHTLKASPAVSLLCAALIYFIYSTIFFGFPQKYRKPFFTLVVVVITALNILSYYAINRPGKFSKSGEPYEKEKLAGIYIRQNALPDEVIFIEGFEDEPQIILYAHRNMRTITANSDAGEFLRRYHRSKGVIFTINSRGFVITEEHISI
jgi:hypothetical protein